VKPGRRVVVISAGVGGVTAAALLLKAGYDVTVLEAHVAPGGSEGTFIYKGFRFFAGATLAAGFAAGGLHTRVGEWLGLERPVQPVDPAWVVQVGGFPQTSLFHARGPETGLKKRMAGGRFYLPRAIDNRCDPGGDSSGQ
jgi:phytoene dehydrogenase-like protein